MNCPNQGITIPPLTSDPCDGERKSTDCIFLASAITYLELPQNSSLTTILNALLVSLVDARARIEVLEGQVENLDERVTALE